MPAEQTKAVKLQALQACFLVQTEIHQIHVIPHMTHNPQQVYDTLQTFTVSLTMAPSQPSHSSMQSAPWKKGGIPYQVPLPASSPGMQSHSSDYQPTFRPTYTK